MIKRVIDSSSHISPKIDATPGYIHRAAVVQAPTQNHCMGQAIRFLNDQACGTPIHVLDQLADCGAVTARKMFGEYCLYYAGCPVGLVCDNQLFLKNTLQGRGLIEEVVEAAPYPRARPHLLLTADQWDDRHNLCQLVRVTADALSLVEAPGPVKVRKTRVKRTAQ